MSIEVLEIAVNLLRQLKEIGGEDARMSVGEAPKDINEMFGTLIISVTVELKRQRDGAER